MQHQSPKRNRWNSLSMIAIFLLFGSSIGCAHVGEHWSHHWERHSVVTDLKEKREGRYYHCPHCGQIVPREGFYKCPRCMSPAAFFGYEATCWRQFPEGWGCPPETVTNNPQFWDQGLIESEVVVEEAIEAHHEDLQNHSNGSEANDHNDSSELNDEGPEIPDDADEVLFSTPSFDSVHAVPLTMIEHDSQLPVVIPTPSPTVTTYRSSVTVETETMSVIESYPVAIEKPEVAEVETPEPKVKIAEREIAMEEPVTQSTTLVPLVRKDIKPLDSFGPIPLRKAKLSSVLFNPRPMLRSERTTKQPLSQSVVPTNRNVDETANDSRSFRPPAVSRIAFPVLAVAPVITTEGQVTTPNNATSTIQAKPVVPAANQEMFPIPARRIPITP